MIHIVKIHTKKSSPRKTASREIGLNGHNIANHAAVEFEKVDVICIKPRGQSEVSIDLRWVHRPWTW